MARVIRDVNIEALREELEYWQRLLRLRDWDIEILIVARVDDEDSFGGCTYSMSSKCAEIRILEPQQAALISSCAPFCPFQTLIHELVHLHFCDFWDPDLHQPMERAIEQLANGYWRLRYEGPDPAYTSPSTRASTS